MDLWLEKITNALTMFEVLPLSQTSSHDVFLLVHRYEQVVQQTYLQSAFDHVTSKVHKYLDKTHHQDAVATSIFAAGAPAVVALHCTKYLINTAFAALCDRLVDFVFLSSDQHPQYIQSNFLGMERIFCGLVSNLIFSPSFVWLLLMCFVSLYIV